MRVFVAGATGVIGQFLVPGLIAAGHQVTASTRSQAKATGLARPQVTASLTVARSPVATSAAERWDFLTLDQAATLAEFEDDQEALTALVQAASPAGSDS